MPQFSESSKKKVAECRVELQVVLTDAIKAVDFSVICGFRSKEEQDKAVAAGNSKVKFPNSKHNKSPSEAFDIYPYSKKFGLLLDTPAVITKIMEKTGKSKVDAVRYILEEFMILAGVIKGVAASNRVPIRWGGDWDSDGDRLDQSFNDLAHFELITD
jgi:peptidoglycan L-alanyl-D-glutamate endopeptidase CwlK